MESSERCTYLHYKNTTSLVMLGYVQMLQEQTLSHIDVGNWLQIFGIPDHPVKDELRWMTTGLLQDTHLFIQNWRKQNLKKSYFIHFCQPTLVEESKSIVILKMWFCSGDNTYRSPRTCCRISVSASALVEKKLWVFWAEECSSHLCHSSRRGNAARVLALVEVSAPPSSVLIIACPNAVPNWGCVCNWGGSQRLLTGK